MEDPLLFKILGHTVAPLCSYWNQWMVLVKDVMSRWRWVFEAIDNLNYDFDFVEVPKATNTLEERAIAAELPLERMVKTVYVGINDKKYSLILPELKTLTEEAIYNVFKETGHELSDYDNIIINEDIIPDSMELRTTTPFVAIDEFSSIDGMFIHMDTSFFCSEDKEVFFCVGGHGDFASRVLVRMPYKAIFDILNYAAEGKVVGINFYDGV